MTTTRRILMLHGHVFTKQLVSYANFEMRQIRAECLCNNDTTIQLGALRKAVDKDIELVFVDAPMVLQPVDLDGSSANELGASEAATATSDPALTPRGWFKSNPERTAARGLEEALQTLKDVLSRDRYVGVFGFSQGAAMAALLAALLEKPHMYPAFLTNGEPIHPPFQFCVSVSGFKVGDPLASEIFRPSYSTPTLHVLGKTDVIVIEERSNGLLGVSSGARVEKHEGGHFVPSNANWRNFFRAYLRDPLGDVPSPRSGVISNSGTVTPITPESDL